MATIASERWRSFDFGLQETTIHGHRVAYRLAGTGPAIVLIHGITSSSQTWEEIGPRLAREYTVLAPDLLGHGETAKPRGDYSMGAFASGVRDLMIALDIGPATVIGHSLGGGVAMQFAYQFPERTERLALASSGGLGREVHWLLRAATLPGSEIVLPLLAHERVLLAGGTIGRALGQMGLKLGTDAAEMARGHASLGDAETRLAFIHTLRASLDPIGQRVQATDRLYLASQLPLLITWGARDKIIPIAHGRRAHEMIPGSRFEVFEDAGHFAHLDEPDRFVSLIREWIDSSVAGVIDEDRLRELLAEQNA